MRFTGDVRYITVRSVILCLLAFGSVKAPLKALSQGPINPSNDAQRVESIKFNDELARCPVFLRFSRPDHQEKRDDLIKLLATTIEKKTKYKEEILQRWKKLTKSKESDSDNAFLENQLFFLMEYLRNVGKKAPDAFKAMMKEYSKAPPEGRSNADYSNIFQKFFPVIQASMQRFEVQHNAIKEVKTHAFEDVAVAIVDAMLKDADIYPPVGTPREVDIPFFPWAPTILFSQGLVQKWLEGTAVEQTVQTLKLPLHKILVACLRETYQCDEEKRQAFLTHLNKRLEWDANRGRIEAHANPNPTKSDLSDVCNEQKKSYEDWGRKMQAVSTDLLERLDTLKNDLSVLEQSAFFEALSEWEEIKKKASDLFQHDTVSAYIDRMGAVIQNKVLSFIPKKWGTQALSEKAIPFDPTRILHFWYTYISRLCTMCYTPFNDSKVQKESLQETLKELGCFLKTKEKTPQKIKRLFDCENSVSKLYWLCYNELDNPLFIFKKKIKWENLNRIQQEDISNFKIFYQKIATENKKIDDLPVSQEGEIKVFEKSLEQLESTWKNCAGLFQKTILPLYVSFATKYSESFLRLLENKGESRCKSTLCLERRKQYVDKIKNVWLGLKACPPVVVAPLCFVEIFSNATKEDCGAI